MIPSRVGLHVSIVGVQNIDQSTKALMRSLISCLTLVLITSGCTLSGPMNWPLRSAPKSTEQSSPTPQSSSAGPLKSHTRGNKSPYQVFGKTYHVMPSSLGYVEIGIASWYGKKFHGRLTSNGEVYDMYQISAAHKALPLPSVVRVTNLDNGRKVIVRVNDRGPFHSDRVIDLSYQAALALGFTEQGTAPVVIEAIDEQNYPGQTAVPVHHESFYLQVGAFSNAGGAQPLLAAINGLMVQYEQIVDARILESELKIELKSDPSGELKGALDKEVTYEHTNEQKDETAHKVLHKVLHKVWLGPIKTEADRDTIAQIVQTHNLGVPIRVKVD
jgi:rare lipoprotein A